MFTIKLHYSGDEADAETDEAALLAAATMVDDATRFAGQARKIRATITIDENGTYNGFLTNLARHGVRRVDLVAAGVHRRRASRHEDAAQRFRGFGLDQAATTAETCAREEHSIADQLEGAIVDEIAGAIDEASGTVYSDAEGGL